MSHRAEDDQKDPWASGGGEGRKVGEGRERQRRRTWAIHPFTNPAETSELGSGREQSQQDGT